MSAGKSWKKILPALAHSIDPPSPLPFALAALFSNFLGVTSLFLSADGGGFARSLRLDVLVPVRGFKRCFDSRNGFGTRAPFNGEQF